MNIELTPAYIWSQVFTIVMYVFLMICYQLKKRKSILIVSIIALLCNMAAYILLQAWTGLAMCAIALFRNLYSYWDESVHPGQTKITTRDTVILVVVYLAMIIVSIPTYNGFLSLMSVFATMTYTYSIWQKNTLVYKFMGVPVGILWIIYNAFVGSFFGVTLEAVLCAASLIGFIVALKAKKNGKRHKKSSR